MAKKSKPRDGCGHRLGVRGGGGYGSLIDPMTEFEHGSRWLPKLVTSLRQLKSTLK